MRTLNKQERDRNRHVHLALPDETLNEQPYTIEDGVLVDVDSRPNARKAYDEFTRYWPKTAEEFRAEEAAWAARSGPVITIRKGRKAS